MTEKINRITGNECIRMQKERVLKRIHIFAPTSRAAAMDGGDRINLETSSSWPYKHEGWLTRPKAIDRR